MESGAHSALGAVAVVEGERVLELLHGRLPHVLVVVEPTSGPDAASGTVSNGTSRLTVRL